MSSSKYLGSLGAEARAELEQRLLTRQSGRCFICDEAIDLLLHKGQLDVDHIDPLAEDGLDAENNFYADPRVLQQEQGSGQPPGSQTDQGVRAVAGARQAGRNAGREPRRRPGGTVKFSGSVPDLADEERHAELPRIPLSPRDHQPRRLAVSPLRCELSRCRRSPGPTRHHGVLRGDPAVVPHVRFSIRSPAQASTGPAGRHLAPGRGLRHHPGTAALSLACRRSRWRRPRYPRPVAS